MVPASERTPEFERFCDDVDAGKDDFFEYDSGEDPPNEFQVTMNAHIVKPPKATPQDPITRVVLFNQLDDIM